MFLSNRNGEIDLYTLELASGIMTQLTDNAKEGGLSAAPNWSPDGRQIAYEHVVPGKGRHVYIMDADGKNPSPLLKEHQPHFNGLNLVSRGFPRWSPDGKRILYFVDELRTERGPSSPCRQSTDYRRQKWPASEGIEYPQEVEDRRRTLGSGWQTGGLLGC